METVGADACGVLMVVEKGSWENEEVQKLVTERGFVKVAETNESYVLVKPEDDQENQTFALHEGLEKELQQQQEEEEEEEGKTQISVENIIDFNEETRTYAMPCLQKLMKTKEKGPLSLKEKCLKFFVPTRGGCQHQEELEVTLAAAKLGSAASFRHGLRKQRASRTAHGHSELAFRKSQSRFDPYEEPKTYFMRVGKWISTNEQQLKDVGMKSLNLSMNLRCLKSKTSATVWREDKEKYHGNLREITIEVSSATIELEEEPLPSNKMKHIVYKLEVKLTPTQDWAGDDHCFDVKASPDAPNIQLTVERSTGVTGSVTLGMSQAPEVQVGTTRSTTVTEVVAQHAWRSQLYPRYKAVEWIWAICYQRDGRPFNPSKTQLFTIKGGKISQQHIEKVLGSNLIAEPSLRISASNVKATWIVDCNLAKTLDLTVEVTLHTTAFRIVNLLKGCYELFSSSRAGLRHQFVHSGRLSI